MFVIEDGDLEEIAFCNDVEVVGEVTVNELQEKSGGTASSHEAPVGVERACPRCGSGMVERQNRQTGSHFLGCRGFPNCRGTRERAPARPATQIFQPTVASVGNRKIGCQPLCR